MKQGDLKITFRNISNTKLTTLLHKFYCSRDIRIKCN